MKKNIVVLFLFLMVFAVAGCGKKSGVEGKLVDGQGKPMADVKIIANQVQPIKGYEQFEVITGSDGTFRFKKLFPTSEYILSPWISNGKTDAKVKLESCPEGETIMLSSPMVIRFISKNDIVTDTKTGLMWAASDNGKNINWPNAKAYCANYEGGGFSDWRLPTTAELKVLYKAGIRFKRGDIINLTACCPWASETRGSTAANFKFNYGKRYWTSQSFSSRPRALPVRSGK